jgi:hypothetical protein
MHIVPMGSLSPTGIIGPSPARTRIIGRMCLISKKAAKNVCAGCALLIYSLTLCSAKKNKKQTILSHFTQLDEAGPRLDAEKISN